MAAKFKNLECCRFCGSELFHWLDLGKTALAGSHILSVQDKEYPLNIMFCENCYAVQTKEVIDASVLFSNYNYCTSHIPGLVKHFKEVAESIDASGKILEIGGNSGEFLKNFVGKATTLVNVDPSDVAANHKPEGVELENCFFTSENAKSFLSKYGKFDYIFSFNSFAHIDDMKDVLKGISSLLSEKAQFIFEVHWLGSIIKDINFDFFYHEHMSYYSVMSLVNFLETNRIYINKVEKINTHGGSIRVTCSKVQKSDKSVQMMLKEEEDIGLNDKYALLTFKQDIERAKEENKYQLDKLTLTGKTIDMYGASGRAVTLVSFFEIENYLDCCYDDSELRQRKFLPGTGIYIFPSKQLEEFPPDYIYISAWTFAKEIMERNPNYKGKWIIPLPEFKIV